MNHWLRSIILLTSLVVFTVVSFAANEPPPSWTQQSDVPLKISSSTPPPIDQAGLSIAVSATISISRPITPATSAHNPAFEQIVNLGVPAGNGATPWQLALNSQAGLVYLLTEGLPILKQGNGLSVYDIEAGEIVAHRKINQGSPNPLDLQFDSHTGLLYALWTEISGTAPPTLSVIDSESLRVIQELPDVEAFTVAEGLLYTASQASLTIWAFKNNTLTPHRQTNLTPASTSGPLAVNPTTDRLYLARANNETWTMEVFEFDPLTRLDSYPATGPISDILPNPATGEVFVVEGLDDLRLLHRLTAGGQPIATPYELGPRFIASGIALSPDGKHLYFSNGQIRPVDPEPDDDTGPAFIGLATADLTPRHKISLPTNFDDLVIDAQTNQAFAVYPFDDLLYVIDLNDETVQIVNTAIEIRDVLADSETGVIFVFDSAHRIRRLDDETFATLAETQPGSVNDAPFLDGSLYTYELALDRERNRLYVSGNPAFILEADTLAPTATLDPGGQFAFEPGGDKIYLSHCGVTILDAQTLISKTVIPGSTRRGDWLVPNPCVDYSWLDPTNQLLYSRVPNGVPGSNSGSYLYLYDLTTEPTLIFTDTNLSVTQALPDPANRRAFTNHPRYGNLRLRTLSVSSDRTARYTHQLIGLSGKMGYSPPTNRLYLSDLHRLLTLDAATLDVIGEMPLPPRYDYQLAALDPTHERLYLVGYDGQLLMANGSGSASRQENLAALQASKALSLTERRPTGTILTLESAANGYLLARIATGGDGSLSEPRLFLSRDGGRTWTDLSKSLSPFAVQAVAVSPHYPNDQTLFALTASGNTGGLYQSTDGGQTWAAEMRGLRDLGTAQVFISPNFALTASKKPETNLPSPNQLIFVGTTYAGLHYSVDGGQHWTPLVQLDPNDLLPGSSTGAVAIDSNGLILASQSLEEMDGLFRTTLEPDGSLSDWQQVLDIPLSLLAFAPDGRTVLGFGPGLWRSADGGRTWHPGGAGLSDLDRIQANRFLFSPTFADDQTVYLFFTDIRGDDSGRLFRSTDGGQIWQRWSSPPESKRITAVTLTTDGDFLFGDSETGVTRESPARLTWLEPELPSTPFPIDDLAVSPKYALDQTLFVVSHQQGLFKSTDGGRAWQQTDFPVRSTSFEGYRLGISPAYDRDRTIYAATGFSLHRSADGGQTWRHLPFESKQGPGLLAEQIALSPNFASDHTLLVSTPKAIFRSTDRGDTWRQVLTRPAEAGPARILTFAPSSEIAYAWFDYYNTLFVSADGGQHWSAQPGRPDDFFSVATAAVTPDGSLTIASDFPAQLLQVSDLGRNWGVLTDTLPEALSDLQAMAYTPDGTLLVGGQGGLFESKDDGQTWQSLNTGLPPNVDITLLRLVDSHRFIVLREGNIFVFAEGGSSWHSVFR